VDRKAVRERCSNPECCCKDMPDKKLQKPLHPTGPQG